jgi:FKBP-type peptidyl-prolyl cis-trans isomerase
LILAKKFRRRKGNHKKLVGLSIIPVVPCAGTSPNFVQKGVTVILKMTLKWMAVVGVGLLAAQAGAEEAFVFKTQKDKVSYGIGADMGRNLKRQGIDVDVDLLVKGLRDAFSGEKLLMTDNDLRKTIEALQADLMRKQRATRIAAVNNKEKGEVFLAENKTKEGVVTLPSGLQYKILRAGEGKKPTDADTVECHYRGTLIDGTEFDSSYRAGQPATFKVAGVIPGWKEALKLMPVGSKWQLFIPPQLAYGARGLGEIGPNATLIFEIEILAIK